MSIFEKRQENPAEEHPASEEPVAGAEEIKVETSEQTEEIKQEVREETESKDEVETEDAPPVSESAESVEENTGEEAAEEPILDKKAQKKAEKEAKKAEKEAKKAEKEARKGKGKAGTSSVEDGKVLYSRDTVLLRSDSVAHRNKHYTPHGRFSQTLTATGVELKRLRKTASFPILILWAVLILVCANVDSVAKFVDIYDARVGLDILQYMGKILFLFPIIAVFYCAKSCYTVPVLFRDRIAYLHFALPVSKGSLYMGKFLAYLFLSFAMIAVFYGCAFASGQMYYVADEASIERILISLGMSLLASFAMVSMIMCFSIKRDHPSMLRALLILFGTYSVVYCALHVVYEKITLSSTFLTVYEKAMEYVGYLPMNGYDFAMEYIGATGFYSGKTLAESFAHTPALLDLDYRIAAGVYFAWGLFFLSLGLKRFKRRQL